MDKKVKVVLVLGAARDGRFSEKPAKFIERIILEREEIELVYVDVKNYLFGKTLPEWEGHEESKGWKKIAVEANAFVIVTPEYNRGYPGELKILLDAAYDQYYRKPVLMVGVSSGPWGGVRVVEHMRSVLNELGMIQLQNGIFFPFVEKAFDENGNPLDKGYEKKTNDKLDELVELTKALIPIQKRKK